MSLGHANNLRLTPLSALGAGLIIAAAALRLSTYRALGRLFTFHISIQDDHRLVTTGPYSVVRHPSYAGLVVAHLGWVFWNASSGSWVRESGMWKNLVGKIFITAYAAGILGASSMVTLSRMSNEDAALRERFGKEWDEWAKRVLYKVFPGVY
ncbi:hypothetical protein B0H34DRAFT_94097 [Crassisporium funariophilum]|nr:hypothetical protein B0H34DRAFT_94097 [Crassisporium funariophilum]